MYYLRRIQIEGTIPEKDIDKLISFVTQNSKIKLFANESPSILGLNNWITPTVLTIGNIYCKSMQLEELITEWDLIVHIFPDIDLKIHFGGLYGKPSCIGTIIARKGRIKLENSMIEKILRVPSSIINQNVKTLFDHI